MKVNIYKLGFLISTLISSIVPSPVLASSLTLDDQFATTVSVQSDNPKDFINSFPNEYNCWIHGTNHLSNKLVPDFVGIGFHNSYKTTSSLYAQYGGRPTKLCCEYRCYRVSGRRVCKRVCRQCRGDY